MRSICLYLQVHQPFRIDGSFGIGPFSSYFGDGNKEIFNKVALNSYYPTNKILLKLLNEHNDFKLSLSFSGIVLDQMEEYSPATLALFQRLVKTGRVEILSETYYHSLAFFYSRDEFERQVEMHRRKVKKLFGISPMVFRNTELSYNNSLAKWAQQKNYHGILTEGWDAYLADAAAEKPYLAKKADIKVLVRNYRLSDDISFRFSFRDWIHWPLTPQKFIKRILEKTKSGGTVNLFMDYETFGEHHIMENGIFKFLENMTKEILKKGWIFKTVSETLDSFEAKNILDVPKVLSWADTERDLSAWMGNAVQKSCLKSLYGLEDRILETGDRKLIEDWRRLQTSDHFYYMCTKNSDDGGVHKYFSPYESSSEAGEIFKRVLNDLESRAVVKKQKLKIVVLPQPI